MECDDKTRAICTALHAQIVHKAPLQIAKDDDHELIRKINLQNLRTRKKLCLVLDLDHTLVHTKRVLELSPKEQNCLGDFLRKDDICRWKLATGVRYLTKLRPFVREFLKEASKLFDMYIYTNGSRDYARCMAGLLDPDRVYFGSRVKSMEDSTVKGLKGLDIVPVHKSGVVILDDTEKVWARDRSNLVVINRYNYFAPKDPNSSKSLFEEGTDESESDGPLSCALELLQDVHRSYFELFRMFDVKEVLGISPKDNGNHEEKLEVLGISSKDNENHEEKLQEHETEHENMGSGKRKFSDECSSCDVSKRQRC